MKLQAYTAGRKKSIPIRPRRINKRWDVFPDVDSIGIPVTTSPPGREDNITIILTERDLLDAIIDLNISKRHVKELEAAAKEKNRVAQEKIKEAQEKLKERVKNRA